VVTTGDVGDVPFVTGLKNNPPDVEGVCGWVGIEEKTKGAFGTDAGAVLVPDNEAKTSAGQHT
jgi:hypothetical protein